ncbi:potassium channel family protein [Bifidobacterium breve]|uniref:Potassium channel family protein n=1 Tax=Bifidobacterium breve TaxID=1685 RepID=A0AAX3NIK7_BIFBR|nr:potassium channel family protein [Bifidobacterium breve]WEB54811.1 potassium channel family protein [Bifidobacterium breve]
MGLKTWKKWTDRPLMVLSVVFLVVYSWEILSRTHIALCETVINVIWVVFVVDYVVSLWWAFVTVTTVGYGDFSPVTFQGKIIAVVLMFTGIALIGIATATLASWIVDQVNLETDRREDAREKEVAKEAAQEAIAAVAAKARVPEGTKRAAAPGSAAAMPPSPEIELLREEVRELAAMVAGLRAELERR